MWKTHSQLFFVIHLGPNGWEWNVQRRWRIIKPFAFGLIFSSAFVVRNIRISPRKVKNHGAFLFRRHILILFSCDKHHQHYMQDFAHLTTSPLRYIHTQTMIYVRDLDPFLKLCFAAFGGLLNVRCADSWVVGRQVYYTHTIDSMLFSIACFLYVYDVYRQQQQKNRCIFRSPPPYFVLRAKLKTKCVCAVLLFSQ